MTNISSLFFSEKNLLGCFLFSRLFGVVFGLRCDILLSAETVFSLLLNDVFLFLYSGTSAPRCTLHYSVNKNSND